MPYDGGMNAFAHALAQPGAPRVSQVARALGVTVATVCEWRTGRRPVPIVHCWGIERLFAGDVTRRDLRPDDAHLIWPDLAESEPNTPPAPADQARAAINNKVTEEAARV